MDQLQKKEIIQAVLIADNFNDNFSPITNTINSSLLPLVNTPILDYTLETLNRSGIEEVFIFCSNFIELVKCHVKQRIATKCSWSIEMQVNVIGSEGCRSVGDALRDLDAKGLIRGHFILLGADSITNAQLFTILEEHKQKCKFDKGTAMTVVYKKIAASCFRTIDEIVVGIDGDSKRLLFHQRINPLCKEKQFLFPLELFMENSKVILHHDFVDPQIAICAPSVLPLFSDNFDFETRDDFIRGLLINEEILASTIYVSELPIEQYAAKVSNWQTYQMVSNDIINRWVYPLVPDMGICCLKQNYLFRRNNVYRNKNVTLARNVILKEDVVIQENSSIDNETILSCCVVGKNCVIGKNCILEHAYLMDNTIVGDNCILKYCIIGKNVQILNKSEITDGTVIGNDCYIPENVKIQSVSIQATLPEFCSADNVKKYSDKAYIIPDDFDDNRTFNTTATTDGGTADADDDDDDDDDNDAIINNSVVRMQQLQYNDTSSVYSSRSEDDDSSMERVAIQEDANIFLSEVIESLRRGFNEKSNPEFLILEINSSRYAYNMALTEVNFYVVKALFNLSPIKDAGPNVLTGLKQILDQLGDVFKNYIRGIDASRDCLKAIEECCLQNEHLKSKIAQIIHYLYDRDMLTEDAILNWYKQLDNNDIAVDGSDNEWIRNALSKLIEWLEASSEEDDEESDEDDD